MYFRTFLQCKIEKDKKINLNVWIAIMFADRNGELRDHSAKKPYRSKRSGAFDKRRAEPVRLFASESGAGHQSGQKW